MLLHFALVLHFAAIVITFCVSPTFCGDYYILRRNRRPWSIICSFGDAGDTRTRARTTRTHFHMNTRVRAAQGAKRGQRKL